MTKRDIVEHGIAIGALREDQKAAWMRQRKERVLDAIKRWHKINEK